MGRRRGRAPEAQVSADIRSFLSMVGMSCYSLEQGYRKDPGGVRQTPGLADLCVFGPDRYPFFGWIEVKAGKGKLRPSQIVFQEECRKANVPHCVAYCATDVFDWLCEHGVLEAQ